MIVIAISLVSSLNFTMNVSKMDVVLPTVYMEGV